MATLTQSPGIPRSRSTIFGRTGDIAAIKALIDQGDSRIITLTGPGGVGKTRLAARVALKYAFSAVYVSLESVPDPSLVLSAIAVRLNVRDGGDLSLHDQLVKVLADQDVLLILDNFEHVLEGGAAIGELVDRCPRLRVLITSRSRLRIQGEQVFRVKPLPVSNSPASPAIKLFVDRVRSGGDPSFVPSEAERAQIVAICERLDGLPLAIELAAARVPVLTLQGLVDRLDSLLPHLIDGPLDAPERLRSLSRAIGWSYDLLAGSQQRMFRWCSVFDGGWSIDELLAVLGRSPAQEPEVVAELACLVEQSLVVVEAQPHGSTRYRMLESMREFAAEQLRAAGEEHVARSAHANVFLALSRAARSKLLFGGCDEHHDAVQWLDLERRNVRAAFDWFFRSEMSQQALETAASISPFNYLRGNLREDRDCLIAALSLPDDGPSEARAFATVRSSIAHWGAGDADSALVLAHEGYELAKQAGAGWVEGIALSCMAENHVMRGRYQAALEEGLQAIALFRRFGPVYELCWTLNCCGFTAGLIDRKLLSEELLAEGNALCRSGGHDLFLAVSLCDQGILAFNRGDLTGAARLFARSVSMLHQLGDAWYIARSLVGMAGVVLEGGEIDAAARLLGLAEALSMRVGNSPHAVTARQLTEITGRIRPLMSRKELTRLRGEGSAMSMAGAISVIESFMTHLPDQTTPITLGTDRNLFLTRREVEVLRLMASMSDKEIATDLKISRRTVTTHITHIFSKMGVKNRTEAVTVAMSRGIIPNRVA